MQRNFSISIFIALILFGCANSYYGYSKENWLKLSDEEQATAKEEYQSIVDSREAQDTIDARTQSVIDRGINGPRYRK